MKKILLSLSFLVAVISLSAQSLVVNDANAEKRNLSGFHAIKIGGGIDLYLQQGSEDAVAVSASETKYRNRIRTSVEKGVLKIWYDNEGWKWFNSGNHKLKAYVSIRQLDMLNASGASDVFINGSIKSDDLKITLSGASDLRGELNVSTLDIGQSGASDSRISGSAKEVKIDANGASDFKGYDFVVENCHIEASGASTIQITANKEISANASGASDIYYKGNAMVRDYKSSGASSIKKKS